MAQQWPGAYFCGKLLILARLACRAVHGAAVARSLLPFAAEVQQGQALDSSSFEEQSLSFKVEVSLCFLVLRKGTVFRSAHSQEPAALCSRGCKALDSSSFGGQSLSFKIEVSILLSILFAMECACLSVTRSAASCICESTEQHADKALWRRRSMK